MDVLELQQSVSAAFVVKGQITKMRKDLTELNDKFSVNTKALAKFKDEVDTVNAVITKEAKEIEAKLAQAATDLKAKLAVLEEAGVILPFGENAGGGISV